jgi:membrane protein DedA with SNARE-associated domain
MADWSNYEIAMDDVDLNNALVLTTFAGSIVAVIVGYLLAWRSKRTAYRKAGSLVTAVVTGFAGLFMLAWLLGAVMPPPLPDGSPLWEPLVFLLIFLAASPRCVLNLRKVRSASATPGA